MVWLIYYSDEFGTPKMSRVFDNHTWATIGQLIDGFAHEYNWKVTRIELLKTPVLNKEAA